MNNRPPYKQLPVVVVALVLLLAGGAGYRAAASWYDRDSDATPLPPGTLDKLSLDLGGWIGQDVPLDENVIKATDTDQHVNRAYRNAEHTRQVGLWVAYGVRFRDLMPHRPEVCYPGNGWTKRDAVEATLALDNGLTLHCRLLQFERGGLVDRRINVLNYYIIDGQYSPDVAMLRSRIWRPSAAATDVAQVQITCSGGASPEDANEAVRDFARTSALAILDLMPKLPEKPEGES